MIFRKLSTAGLLACAVTFTAGAMSAETLDFSAVDKLLLQGNADRARISLEPLEEAYAGTVPFDYRLGLATLDSGRAGEAVFILERVVATAPEYFGGRMELARAYFEAGDRQRARVQFEYLLAAQPPVATRSVIQNYLFAIEREAEREKSRLVHKLEFGMGADNNVNGATSATSFLGFDLTENSRQNGSMFFNLAGDSKYTKSLSARSEVSASARLGYRHNPSASSLDTTQLRLGTNFTHREGPREFVIGATLLSAAVDSEYSRSNLTIHSSLSADFGKKLSWFGDVRAGVLRFDDALRVRDVDHGSIASGLLLNGEGNRQAQLRGLVVLGKEATVHGGSPYSRVLRGVRFDSSVLGNAWTRISLSGGVLESTFADLFFGEKRIDKQTDLTLAFAWQNVPTARWGIQNWWRWVDNQSSVALFDYDGFQVGMSASRQFD